MTKYLKFTPITEIGGKHLEVVEHEPSPERYKALAAEVGGDFIEYCPIMVNDIELAAICDEEGRCKATIPPASTIYEADMNGKPVLLIHTVGTILLTMPADEEGNDVDITKAAADAVTHNLFMAPPEDGKEHVVLKVHFDWSKAKEVA